jgi:hypothetical protein
MDAGLFPDELISSEIEKNQVFAGITLIIDFSLNFIRKGTENGKIL